MPGLAQEVGAGVQGTESSVTDAKQLVRHINQLQQQIQALRRALDRVPISTGRFITVTVAGKPTAAVPFVSGTPQYLAHGLGRPFVGYLVTGQADVGSLKEVALLSGQTPDRVIGLQSNVTTNFNIYVF